MFCSLVYYTGLCPTGYNQKVLGIQALSILIIYTAFGIKLVKLRDFLGSNLYLKLVEMGSYIVARIHLKVPKCCCLHLQIYILTCSPADTLSHKIGHHQQGMLKFAFTFISFYSLCISLLLTFLFQNIRLWQHSTLYGSSAYYHWSFLGPPWSLNGKD